MYVWLDMQIYDSSTFIKSLEYVIKGKSIDFLTYDNNITRDFHDINMMKDQGKKFVCFTVIFEILYNTIFYKQILFWKSH